MRQLASFLLLGLAVAAHAADTWRWKDANGVVHYSDRPVPGASLVTLGPETSAGNPQPVSTQKPPVTAATVQPAVVYTSCAVVAPANDEVFTNVHSVAVSLMVLPGLQQGHRMQVQFDGQPYPAWPEGALSSTLLDLFRGTHTLSVRIVNATGRALCTGPVVSFHVLQPTLLSPARQPVKR